MTMTHSLGMPSGVITDGLGFMYNGCMGVFDPRPGRAGSRPARPASVRSSRPSCSRATGRTSSSAPPGATQIAMGVLQVLLNVLDFGMTMVEAVSAPRFSATSNAIDLSNRIPRRSSASPSARLRGRPQPPYATGSRRCTRSACIRTGSDGGADPGHDGIALAV